MLLFQTLQRQSGWQFDLRSALIGALVAWILAGIAYNQRALIKRLLLQLWEPIAAWKRRVSASQEEKYLRVLRQRLRRLLLLKPKDPVSLFYPPTFTAPAPLPTTIAEVTESPRTLTIPYANLLKGYHKLIITGTQGAGRTTTLLMTAWQTEQQAGGEDTGQRFTRLPVWVDLSAVQTLKTDDKASGLEQLVALASLAMPEVLPKWLLQHLRREPSLILLDNWDQLTLDQRTLVSHWIDDADGRVADAFWIVASSKEGYGKLTEIGFVPVELDRPDEEMYLHLYQGWRELFGQDSAAPDDTYLDNMRQSYDAGAQPWELQLRTVLYLRTGKLVDRPAEVVENLLQAMLMSVELGKGYEAAEEMARPLALEILIDIAAMQRLKGQVLSKQAIREAIEAKLPPKTERPRRLENAVRKLINASRILRYNGQTWEIAHPLWSDYLTAVALARDPEGQASIRAHIADPTWYLLTEFFAGLADVEETIRMLISESRLYGDHSALLRAARWGIVTDPKRPWRKDLIKALARAFAQAEMDDGLRLRLGYALIGIVGTEARAFFLHLLRQQLPSAIRQTALRCLGKIGSAADVPVLAVALREPDPDLSRSAVFALRDLGTPGAIAFLREALPQAEEDLMPIIAEALATTAESQEALDEASQFPDLLVRRAAAYGLGKVGTDWAKERLIEMAREDPEWLVRSAADTVLQALEERAQQQAKVLPPPQVDQMDWLISWAARQGEGLGVGEAAVQTLLRAARQGNVDAKVLSALTLAQIGREDHLPIVEPMLTETDPAIRKAATWATDEIKRRYRIFQVQDIWSA